MKDATYRGVAGRAIIRKEDWSKVGVDSTDVTWNGYGDTQSVAEEAAEHLAKYDDRFEVEGAEDDSAYARRLRVDRNEQLNRQRVGTRGGIAPDMQAEGEGVPARHVADGEGDPVAMTAEEVEGKKASKGKKK